MKKAFISCFFIMLSCFVFAQTNNTVDITDDVYVLLRTAETKGLCSRLSNVKPYTEKYILERLAEIEESLSEKEDDYRNKVELYVTKFFIDKYRYKNGLDLSRLNYRIENNSNSFPISFDVQLGLKGFCSGGVYKDSSENSYGYETYGTLDFYGDFGKDISYRAFGYIDLTKMPITLMGTYYIGNWWDSTHDKINLVDDDTEAWDSTDPRYIKKWRNYSVLPYSYKKHWDGSVYHLTKLTAEGLQSWPHSTSLGFGMFGELHGSFFNNHLELGVGRYNREWAEMDEGSSLALNQSAHPFLGIDTTFRLFDFISLSSLFGGLEFPNEAHVNSSAWYLYDEEWDEDDYVKGVSPGITDAYFFQNLFALGMLNLDFKYVHFDFGSTCILPKRFEFGYMFPLIDNVIYQNSVGDFDNLGLFANLKIQKPGLGYIWFSLFSDDITSFKAKFWEEIWCTYAYQAGIKSIFNWLPFGTVSFRYTKVEPYCYTHPAIKVPWYRYYISTAYVNNGASLGYYLQPNSDEFLVRFEARPMAELNVGLSWQLIRHGVDWGSGAVYGSNLYSELVPGGERNSIKKYFLLDGTYEWSNIICIDCSYNLKTRKIPVVLNVSFGYIYDWFTGVDNNGQKNSSFHYINDDEYPEINGFVISAGFTIFGK